MLLVAAMSAHEIPPGVVSWQSQEPRTGIAQIVCKMQQFHVIVGHEETA